MRGLKNMWMKSCSFFGLSICIALHAGPLDEAFDATTIATWEALSCLHVKSYQESYEFFLQLRKKLLRDGALHKLFSSLTNEDKQIFPNPKEGFVLKKRPRQRILEFYAWETSFLLDEESSIVPSFPLWIADCGVIIQEMEPFLFGKGKQEMPPLKEIQKVSLEEYWLAHLRAYLLGLGDLLGRNMGINPQGKIRFFDAEYAFFYTNLLYREDYSIVMGFRAESMDWSQFTQPLDRKTVQVIQKFIVGLEGLEERLQIYEQMRHVTLFSQGAYERLQQVREFPLQEGVTFNDFLFWIYPSLQGGLEPLQEIVSAIYKRKVGPGTALIFLSQYACKRLIADKYKERLRAWIDLYIP